MSEGVMNQPGDVPNALQLIRIATYMMNQRSSRAIREWFLVYWTRDWWQHLLFQLCGMELF